MVTQNLSLLIADDEASIRKGLCNMIPWDELNISVLSTAQDGQEALELIKEHKPDIVLTDIRMPRLDGLQLISEVKKLKLNTRFIIISGYDDFKYAQIAMRYGVKSYLLKPIKKAELIEEVKGISSEIFAEHQRNSDVLVKNHNLLLGNHALKEKFFSRLLQNEFRKEREIIEETEKLDLNIQNKPIQVIVFNYEIPDSENTKVDGSLYKSQIKGVIENALSNAPSIAFEYSENNVVAVINTPLILDGKTIEIKDFCSQCIEELKGSLNVDIYVGIGNTADSLLSANESYRIALDSLSYKLYESPQRIFDSSDLCHTSIHNISANDMDNSELIDAIYKGSVEEMLQFTDSFFNSIFPIKTPPPSFIRGMCIYLVIDVQKGLTLYLDRENELFTEKPYVVINQLPFLHQIKEWIITLFTDYIYYIKNTSKYKKDPIIEKAKVYIKENILKKIKADEVAAHVNLSESYFTAYFKEKTHENFSNYILNLKIDHAKNLLKTTDKPISEISFLLGYEDYRSFIRVFKKSTGKNPSEYRNMYQN